jgi:hypothetical protein
MFKHLTAFLLVTLAICNSVHAQTKPSVADLFWLSGCWQGRQGTAVVEEIWSKPAGTSMLGLGRTVKDNRTVSFEFMQLREQDGMLAFLPQPQGGPQVRFPLKESTSGKFTFENLNHDFPQRVIYERKNSLLVASIEGTQNGKFSRHEFVLRKVRCN